jgi:hypothetical protein
LLLYLSNVINANDAIKSSQFPFLKYYAYTHACMGISQLLAFQPENLKDLLGRRIKVS